MNESIESALSVRWLGILRGHLTAVPCREPVSLPDSLHVAIGQHRAWIIECLRAIDALRAGVDFRFEHPLTPIALPKPAIAGSEVANAVYLAYLRYCLRSHEAADILANAVRSLDPTALRAGVDNNPEPWWANELLILHALQSFVYLHGDAELQEHLNRCVDFHIAEIQPDHATNEPWAIHAFGPHPEGTMTAETLLHASMVQGGGELTPTARLIVADAAYTLAAAIDRG